VTREKRLGILLELERARERMELPIRITVLNVKSVGPLNRLNIGVKTTRKRQGNQEEKFSEDS
jgi:hypothetical protein